MPLTVPTSSMALISLIVLVAQNSLLVVMTRLSRKRVDAAHNYHTSTLVINQEIVKMVMCLILYGLDDVYKQYQHDAASSDCASSTKHNVVASESNALLLREDRANSVEGKVFQAESKEAPPAVDDEPLEVHVTSSPVPLPQTMVAGIVSVESTSHMVDELRADDDTSGMPQVRSTYRSGATLGIMAPFSRQVLRLPFVNSLTGLCNALAHPSTRTTDHGEFSRSVDVPETMRKGNFFMRRGTKTLCALYCSMLCASLYKRDTLKLLVPAFLFNLQNFLIFVGLSNLDAVSFQIWSQTKLLSTAVFSVWLLGRKLSPMQWLSLVALTAGVLGAQLGTPKVSVAMRPTAARHLLDGSTKTPDLRDAQLHAGDDNEPGGNALIGIAACVLSGLSSSYAGVYFEKVVKTTSPTLSLRNIQLSLFGIPIGVASMLFLDVFPNWYASLRCGQRVNWNIFSPPTAATRGLGEAETYCHVQPFYFWQRYDDSFTWALVFIHALGGLLVAIVVKYTDNILKGFATGVAVIVSGMMCFAIDGYQPSLAFVPSAALVIGSSIVFHKFERRR